MDSEMPPSMQDTAMTQETSAAHPADTGAIMVSHNSQLRMGKVVHFLLNCCKLTDYGERKTYCPVAYL